MKRDSLFRKSIYIICAINIIIATSSCMSSNSTRYGKYKPKCPAYKFQHAYKSPKRNSSFSNVNPTRTH